MVIFRGFPYDEDTLSLAISETFARRGTPLPRTIPTFNLKDFPEDALKPYGIEAQHSDECGLRCSQEAKGQPEEPADERRRASRVVGTPGTRPNGFESAQVRGTHLTL